MKSKILLIDDDLLIHFINKKLLQKEYPEEDVYDFLSASRALDFLREEPDSENLLFVIFLDINMPEINGWQFLDILQRDFSHLNFQIHMLTSSISEEDQKKSKEYEHVHSYIFKPLNKCKLLPILESIPSKFSA